MSFSLKHTKHTKKIAFLSILLLLLVVTIFAVSKYIPQLLKVNAINDGNVSIYKTDKIYYGDPNYYEWVDDPRWYTYMYFASTNETGPNQGWLAFCANPGKKSVNGNYSTASYDSVYRVDKIKLAIYLHTSSSSAAIAERNRIFSFEQNNSLRYAYTHAVIGYLFAGDTTGLVEGTALYTRITETIPNQLDNLITTNSEAWQEAQNYSLQGVSSRELSNGEQHIFWIEETTPPEPTPPSYTGTLRIKKT